MEISVISKTKNSEVEKTHNRHMILNALTRDVTCSSYDFDHLFTFKFPRFPSISQYQQVPAQFGSMSTTSEPFLSASNSSSSPPTTLRNVAIQTFGHTIGPMPVDLFLDEFLPRSSTASKPTSCTYIPTRRTTPFVSILEMFFGCATDLSLYS